MCPNAQSCGSSGREIYPSLSGETKSYSNANFNSFVTKDWMCNFAIKMPSSAGLDDTLILTFYYLNNTYARLYKGTNLEKSSSVNAW